MTKIQKIMTGIGMTVGALGMTLGQVLAVDPTPVPIAPDATASQLLVNGVASIQSTLFDTAGLIWPYALGVLLFFLVIRFGMSFFRSH
jgi:hypothetical protein